MIRVLLFLAVLAAVAFGVGWLLEQPGEIAITLPGQARITTSLIGGAAAVALLAIGVIVVWTVLRFLLRLPSVLSFAARARKRARGFAAVSRGMVAVGAGDPRSAKRAAADATKLLGKEPLALLLTAQAAQMAGDRGSAEGAFRQMLDDPETRVLGLRGLFVEARRKGDTAAARAYAAEAARLAPTVFWAGEALLEYQCADADWSGALTTLQRGAKGLDKATVARHRAVLLTAQAQSKAEREPDAALAMAREAVKLAPGLVPAAVLASRLLARRGELRKASKMVEQAWQQEPHPELATAYLEIRPGDSALDRLGRAERLMGLRPHHVESRIALAGTAFAAREFAKARKTLAPLLESRPSVRVCLLMADLEEAENGDAGAVRGWLSRASRAPRDPAWIADGVISDTWAPISPATGRLDAFVWGTPIEQIAAPATPPRLPTADRVIADADEPAAPPLEILPPATEARVPAGAARVEPVSAKAEPVEPAPPSPAAGPAATPAEPATAAAKPAETASAQVQPGQVQPGQVQPSQVLPAQASPSASATVPPAAPATGASPTAAPGSSTGGPAAPAPANVTELRPEARPRRATSDVVFPLPSLPDDPGPDRQDAPARGRTTFLQ